MEKDIIIDKKFNVGLDKWPQMLLFGKPVTQEQASEIIRRTDGFLREGYGGNNHAYNEHVLNMLGLDIVNWRNEEKIKEEYKLQGNEFSQLRYGLFTEWQEKEFKTVYTDYVYNRWIATAYIGGPTGWCNPNGELRFSENIGKWPSVEDVYRDFLTLAKAFPFIEMSTLLMSGESCEKNIYPVIGFVIKDQKVELHLPSEYDVFETYGGFEKVQLELFKSRTSLMDQFLTIMKSANSRDPKNPVRSAENGVPDEMIQSWKGKYVPFNIEEALKEIRSVK